MSHPSSKHPNASVAPLAGAGARVAAPPPAVTASAFSIEALIETAVERAVRRSFGPYLHRLSACEPAVYTVAQAAEVLQVSDDTIGRMVRRGVLPRVPHVGGKVLIPRRALDRLVDAPGLGQAAPADEAAGSAGGDPLSSRSISSEAS